MFSFRKTVQELKNPFNHAKEDGFQSASSVKKKHKVEPVAKQSSSHIIASSPMLLSEKASLSKPIVQSEKDKIVDEMSMFHADDFEMTYDMLNSKMLFEAQNESQKAKTNSESNVAENNDLSMTQMDVFEEIDSCYSNELEDSHNSIKGLSLLFLESIDKLYNALEKLSKMITVKLHEGQEKKSQCYHDSKQQILTLHEENSMCSF